jgi:dTDP-4-amino-4,6-dideoxygalactose transaminase
VNIVAREEFLSFSPPLIEEDEIAAVVDTLRSSWITTGPKTRRFEEEFASYLGAPGALAINSWTAGAHTALVTAGIGPGDEVITTPVTFAASANIVEHVGATPVLVDVEPDTLNIDVSQIEAKVTPNTKAIIPVHFAGHPVDLDPIFDIAKRHNLMVLEDAAHAIPAKYKGKLIGSHGNPVAYSFYATKNLVTAEGGMLVADPGFLERARVVSLHGMSRNAFNRYDKGGSWFYEVTMPGFKYNMTDIQAALGLVQLGKLERMQARRREIVNQYHMAFKDIPALEIPVERPEVEHAWHLYVLRLRLEQLKIDRNQFISELADRNIGSSVHFIPLHLHPFYRDKYGFKPEDFPVAYSNYHRIVSIPLSPKLSDADVADVIEAILEIVKRFGR